MAEASIPIDLFNPGQVFACLGFMEAADILLGDVEGGFDWSEEGPVRFHLGAPGDQNPFAVVLRFLCEAEVVPYAPIGYRDSLSRRKGTDSWDDSTDGRVLDRSETFPSATGDRMALPIELRVGELPSVGMSHWADGSGRNDFKLYAGNRSAAGIAIAMLGGTRGKPKKGQGVGNVKTHGIDSLWRKHGDTLAARPFDSLVVMGGSFNLDPRGAWTAIDAGYSPNKQKHAVAASPVVELLAALGLEHARPHETKDREVGYGAWGWRLPLILARHAISGAIAGVPTRRFRFVFGGTKHNKVVTFAQEETHS